MADHRWRRVSFRRRPWYCIPPTRNPPKRSCYCFTKIRYTRIHCSSKYPGKNPLSNIHLNNTHRQHSTTHHSNNHRNKSHKSSFIKIMAFVPSIAPLPLRIRKVSAPSLFPSLWTSVSVRIFVFSLFCDRFVLFFFLFLSLFFPRSVIVECLIFSLSSSQFR